MTTANRDRALVALVSELCAERGIGLERFSFDWILRLERQGRVEHVYGYDFPLNSATARLIAADKSAVSDLLGRAGLPQVPHRLFLHPRLADYVGAGGSLRAMTHALEELGGEAVLKPNDGTGGNGVARVRSQGELEGAALALFAEHRALALAPFLTVENEYRCLLLDGDCLLLYRKQRPAVVGDGARSIAALAAAEAQPLPEPADAPPGFDPAHIPAVGERALLAWKHNLGTGAVPEPVLDAALEDRLKTLARLALEALNLRLAAIDIIETQGELRILEANTGVMLESFARKAPDGWARAKGVYGVILGAMFGG